MEGSVKSKSSVNTHIKFSYYNNGPFCVHVKPFGYVPNLEAKHVKLEI